MKKYSILALALVLTAALFTGCGCRNNKAEPTTTMPSVMPTTTETTPPTTRETTEASTLPPEKDTTPNETVDHGNGPLETNATAGADGDTGNARSGNARSGNARSGNGSTGTNNGTGNGTPGAEGRARHMPVG